MPLWNLSRKGTEEPTRAGTEHPLWPVHRELDRVLAELAGGGFPDLWDRTTFPSVDVRDEGECVVVAAELPGMAEKDVTVTVQGDGLLIEGTKATETEEKQKGWIRRERRSGSFRRFIALPMGLDLDKATATFKQGVLTVELPRKPEAMPKRRTLNVTAG